MKVISWHKFAIPEIFAPLFFGFCAFYAVLGVAILNPKNIFWLFWSLDPAQHYLGWDFFRQGPWTFPFGLNPRFGIEFSNAIVFSDSIPLMAFIFKPLTHFLRGPFQYMGLWALICFCLQAIFSWYLIGLITQSRLTRLLSLCLFVFAPIFMWRLAYHEALGAHFLLLAALYLTFAPPGRRDPWLWGLLICASSLIHFYLFVMVFGIWVSVLLDRIIGTQGLSKIQWFKQIFFTLLATLVTMWQAGYFSIDASSGVSSGYGLYKLNLLSPFYSRGWSYFFTFEPSFKQEYEGYAYFGLGMIALIPFGCYGLYKLKKEICANPLWAKHRFFLILLVIYLAFAISNNVAIGSLELKVPFPEIFLRWANILRSSGRFFWPVYYLVLLALLYGVISFYPKRLVCLILFLCGALQIIDTSAGWLPLHQRTNVKEEKALKSPLKNPFWQSAPNLYKGVKIGPPPDPGAMGHLSSLHENWMLFAMYAAENGLATNSAMLSRSDSLKYANSIEAFKVELNTGQFPLEYFYILDDWRLHPELPVLSFDPNKDLLAKIDGFTVFAPGWKNCGICYQVPSEMERAAHVPAIAMHETVYFGSKNNPRSKYLRRGWAFSEEWGTWSSEREADLVLPTPLKAHPHVLVINARAFIGGALNVQEVGVRVNGVSRGTFKLTKFEGNSIEVKLSDADVQKGYVEVALKFSNAISPRALGIGHDDRLLAIGITSIRFR